MCAIITICPRCRFTFHHEHFIDESAPHRILCNMKSHFEQLYYIWLNTGILCTSPIAVASFTDSSFFSNYPDCHHRKSEEPMQPSPWYHIWICPQMFECGIYAKNNSQPWALEMIYYCSFKTGIERTVIVSATIFGISLQIASTLRTSFQVGVGNTELRWYISLAPHRILYAWSPLYCLPTHTALQRLSAPLSCCWPELFVLAPSTVARHRPRRVLTMLSLFNSQPSVGN